MKKEKWNKTENLWTTTAVSVAFDVNLSDVTKLDNTVVSTYIQLRESIRFVLWELNVVQGYVEHTFSLLSFLSE